MNNLAWFLVNTDRKITEGLKINEQALENAPDNPYFLDCKGWGLFKLGSYNESMEILEKAYESDINPNHRYIVGLHIQEVRNSQKNRTE